MSLTEAVPVKKGSLREEVSYRAEQSASLCVRPRQRPVCVICVSLFFKET
jgi:hypothetical protein